MLKSLAGLVLVLASAAASARADTLTTDIPYGDAHPDLDFDLYLPDGPLPVPVLVFVHGGTPPGGDKANLPEDHPSLLALLLLNRIAVASINYRPYPQFIYPDQLHDVQLAVQFLRANGLAFGVDPTRLAIWGDSAGALLAGWVSYDADAADPLGDLVAQQSSRPLGYMDYGGLTDFTLMIPAFVGDFFGYPTLGDVPLSLLQQASITWEVCHVPREFTPPCFSVYGTEKHRPPLTNPHDQTMQAVLHEALRTCEPEIAENSPSLQRTGGNLPEIDKHAVLWLLTLFGSEQPMVAKEKR